MSDSQNIYCYHLISCSGENKDFQKYCFGGFLGGAREVPLTHGLENDRGTSGRPGYYSLSQGPMQALPESSLRKGMFPVISESL